ncbi:MAG: glycosyl transferase family 2, partial [Dehalococcoidia bacterium]|nr:glycosyl transferase family 2 [Dehalococcoidia bacterium]
MHPQIAINTIAKNEARNARDFMASCAGADLVAVLDTGSTDGTQGLLRAAGAVVEEAVIEPWRFDTARNQALAMLPEDIDLVVSVDLDERLQPGWREALEETW